MKKQDSLNIKDAIFFKSIDYYYPKLGLTTERIVIALETGRLQIFCISNESLLIKKMNPFQEYNPIRSINEDKKGKFDMISFLEILHSESL